MKGSNKKDYSQDIKTQNVNESLYQHVEYFSVKIGERHMWKSGSLTKASDYIQTEFQKYGYSVKRHA